VPSLDPSLGNRAASQRAGIFRPRTLGWVSRRIGQLSRPYDDGGRTAPRRGRDSLAPKPTPRFSIPYFDPFPSATQVTDDRRPRRLPRGRGKSRRGANAAQSSMVAVYLPWFFARYLAPSASSATRRTGLFRAPSTPIDCTDTRLTVPTSFTGPPQHQGLDLIPGKMKLRSRALGSTSEVPDRSNT
jgi:hypothetical protein